MDKDWHQIENVAEIASPALALYPDRIKENIRRMIAICGDVKRLRPHVKTHKIPEIIKMHLDAGITKFKCATIAEAEMAAAAGAYDVLLAFQPVGPNPERLQELQQKFASTIFSTIVDDEEVIARLCQIFRHSPRPLPVFLDLDCGMHRSGVAPGPRALALFRKISASPGLRPAGLHVYDGHIHEADPIERALQCEESFACVAKFKSELEAEGLLVPFVVAGGTPTFPMHARRAHIQCSPGTCVLWDFGYQKFRDLDFLTAAVLITRVVSKPVEYRLCLDLGHKSVAAETPQPRVEFLNLMEATPVMHSEEHLVVETPQANQYKVGSVIYAIPRHICPTVALQNEVVVVTERRAQGVWKVTARARKISI